MTDAILKILKTVQANTDITVSTVKNMNTELGNVQKSLTTIRDEQFRQAKKIDKMREEQLSCPAKTGHAHALFRIDKLEEKSGNNQIRIESGMKDLRDDITGQMDTTAAAAREGMHRTNSAMLGGVLRTAGPWIAAALLGLGFYMGSGDEEKTLQLIKRVIEQGSPVATLEESTP